jgi:hypothetical protein
MQVSAVVGYELLNARGSNLGDEVADFLIVAAGT